MKITTSLFCLGLLTGSLFFSSCSKTGNTGPSGSQGPAGPSYTGSITGHISLYNQYGDMQQASACKSVRVVLYNSSNAVVDSMNADSVGTYTISNITTGMYTIAFRDTNYGQELHEDFQFLGGSEPLEVDAKLSHIPNFTFTIGGDSIHKKPNDTLVYIYGTVTAASQARSLAVFTGATASVSSGNYSSLVSTLTIATGATTFNISVPVNDFYLGGLVPGQTAYINVYAAAVNYTNSSEYENYNTGQTNYNALGSSATDTPIKL
jgi:hypothetical protein